MARTAQIDSSNLVVNLIEASQSFTLPPYTLVPSETAQIGDSYSPSTGVFTSPVTPAPVPASVLLPQARAALRRAGRIDEVDALVNGIGGETHDWWFYTSNVDRNHPLVAALGAALSPPLSSDDIDVLFRAAATI